jgi:phage terminase large subunit
MANLKRTNAYKEQIVLMVDFRRSIRAYIKSVWGLIPQEIKPEYAEKYKEVCNLAGVHWEARKHEIEASWFGDYNEKTKEWKWYDFKKGVHFSWQQNLILIGIEKAIAGDAIRHLSVVSGHGIGKSATCSWIILWFLYCYAESQVPVTAPTSAQMHDVLWKELSLWINRMPEEYKELYEWQQDYIRMAYAPDSWFARARTSSKENTEAIAGVHADNVAIVVDEASGVPEQVFVTAQGALTSGNVLVVLISNGTRTTGYFYDTHHRNAEDNQLFAFSSEDSPLVDKKYVDKMEKQYGRESEEFQIRVKGEFPGEDMMDDSGYLQLIPMTKIGIRVETELDLPFIGRLILGIDPSGEGKDLYTAVLRDRFKAKLIKSRQTTNPREIAEDILTFIDRYKLDPNDVVIGAFGIGADVGKEVAIATAQMNKGVYEVYSVLEGNSPKNEEDYNYRFFSRLPDEMQNPAGRENEEDVLDDLYLNMRALMYFRARKWLLSGGQIVDTSQENSDFANELAVIKYKRTLHGNKIQLMSKKEMLKLGIKSPNIADAFALTFLRHMDNAKILTRQEKAEIEQFDQQEYDRYSAL